jgi:ABC-type nickel/cobalt efflux system permease component RcnA
MKILVAMPIAILVAAQAFGHPMGNFSISHYAGIGIRTDSVELEYLIDMAEIPTFQEMQKSDTHTKAYLESKAAEFAQGLSVTVDGKRAALKPVSQNVIFPQGAGNLPTMKMGFVYRAALPETCRAKACEISYSDANFPDRAGWKEIVVSIGKGVRREGPELFKVDRSAHLTDYPTDLIDSPPQDLSAKVSFAVVPPPPAPKAAPQVAPEPRMTTTAPVRLQANKQTPPRNAFTELMTHREISFGFALLAALIAAGLGALHAMEPGHGKTIVAAYLVGSKGTARHAVLLGLIVTVSHTAGVYLLGAVTLYAQKYIMPDRLYPYLGVLSGILIAGMGIYILLKRLAGDEFSAHIHGAGGHSHGVPGKRQLLVLGITGGMVPCPAALVVLLSAVALHRVGFGLFLIVAFSLGLATVLIGMGLTAVYAGRLLAKVPIEGKMVRLWMPAMSAAMITILGCTIAVRGLMAAGILEF